MSKQNNMNDNERLAHGYLDELAERGKGADESFVSRIMQTVRDAHEPIQLGLNWLGHKATWAVAASIAVLLIAGVIINSAPVLTAEVSPTELTMYSTAAFIPGQAAMLRVRASDGRDDSPLPRQQLEILLRAAKKEFKIGTATTDEQGLATVNVQVPDNVQEGSYTLLVRSHDGVGAPTVSRQITIERSFKSMISTDKPIYKPGQTIHIRTMTLNKADLKPVAGRKVVLSVKDGKGNKVFRRELTSSDFGIAAVDFVLADQVNLGRYIISAEIDDTLTEKSVEVKQYVLPKFKLTLDTDRNFYMPGQTVKGELTAIYTFGKPVANATVAVNGVDFVTHRGVFATFTGTTDKDGACRFEIPLKDYFVGSQYAKGDAAIQLQAKVVDPAGFSLERSLDLTISSEPIRVDLIPESGELVIGVPNRIFAITSYPDGKPAKATIRTNNAVIKTDETGFAVFEYTPQSINPNFRLQVETPNGQKLNVTRTLQTDSQNGSFLLRTEKAVYRSGDTVNLKVLSQARTARIFIDVIHHQRAIMMTAVDIKDGRGTLALDLDPTVFGTLQLSAYRILPDGNMIRDHRIIRVNRNDALAITATLDKATYRPGEKAVIDFLVKHKGQPEQAALSLAAVDEAVFALSELRPGFAEVYFTLQAELLKPRYEIHGHLPSPTELASGNDRGRGEAALAVAAGQDIDIDRGEPFQRRNARLSDRKEDRIIMLMSGMTAVPFVFAVLAFLLLFRAGFRLLWQFDQVGLDEEMARSLRRLSRRWYAVQFTWLATAILFFVACQADSVGLIIVSSLAASGVIALAVVVMKHIFRNPFMRSLPPLRSVMVTLLALVLVAMIGFGIYYYSGGANESWFALALVAGLVLLAGGSALLSQIAQLIRSRSSLWKRICVLPLRTFWNALLLPPNATDFAVYLVLPIIVLGGLVNAWFLATSIRYDMEAGAKQQLPTGVAKMAYMSAESGPRPTGRGAAPRIRRYFPETLLWKPELITDAQGRARLELPLADSITTWRLTMSGISKDGTLGGATTGIRVFQDFFVDIDFPVELTQNDEVSVPVAVFNYLKTPQTVRLEVQPGDWYQLTGSNVQTLTLQPDEVTSVHFRIKALRPGTHALQIKAFGSEMSDAVERTVRIRPDGEEVVQTINGELSGPATETVTIPATAIEDGSDLFVKVYPGRFSQVVEGLDNIFRMPYGCFEQTSSSTYPNILVLNYMRRTRQINPELEMKALQYINTGYQRLVSFEVDGGGFDWFGNPPANVVLTAYGLMEFCDMAKVYDVDPEVIARTRRWLLSKRRDDGSWTGEVHGIAEGAINSKQGSDLRTTAYVAWAMLEADESPMNLRRTLDVIASKGAAESDPYTLALCANALVAAGDGRAVTFTGKLADAAIEKDGGVTWKSSSQGVTYSRGNVLDIETSALAVYALIKAKTHPGLVRKALTGLTKNKDSYGTWHSTQATVHALRALLLGTGSNLGGDNTVDLAIMANGKHVKTLKITPENSDVHHLVSLRDVVRQGENSIAFEPSAKANLQYQIVSKHYVPWQNGEDSGEKEVLDIQCVYDKTTLKTDDTLGCKVTLRYNRPGTAQMTLVDLGIPPGFDVITDAFQTLKSNGVIEKYTITGRQVILYFREIIGGKPMTFDYKMKAKYPVKAKSPVTAAYQYYEPEVRAEAQPVLLTVE